MSGWLRNSWLWLTVGAVSAFAVPAIASVPADFLLDLFATLLAIVLLGGAFKYMTRAPQHWLDGNMSPEARQIIGYATAFSGMTALCVYGYVFRAMDRPTWLSQQYWAAGIFYTILIGFLAVAWSNRNPAPATKSTRFGSFFLGFLASCALFLSPLAGKIVLAWQMLWKSLMLAVS